MTLRFSTGLRDAMLGTDGFQTAMANGVLRWYTGAQPANADQAATGTLLCEITESGGAFAHDSPTNGLNFDSPASGLISKATAEAWEGVGLAVGVAGWFRFCANPSDTGGVSTTLARIDGTLGKTGADLYVANVNIVVSSPQIVQQFDIGLPA